MAPAEDSDSAWVRTAHIAIALAAAASVAEAVSLGPTAWDGSYLLAQIVERGAPYTPHGRVAAFLPQVPAWLAVQLDAPYGLIRFAFAAGYAASAPVGLWLAWRVARRAGRPDLVVWPILSTCCVLVPAAWFSVSEAVVVAGLVWIPWLAAATGLPRGTRVLGAAALLAVLSMHPLGAGVAVVAAALLVAPALVRRVRPPTWQVRVAAGVVLLAALRVLFVGGDADETSEANAVGIIESTGGALKGPQLAGLAAAGLLALLLWRRREEADRTRLLVVAGVAVACYVAYAAVPPFWAGAHGARFAAILLPVPLTLGLLRDVLRPPGEPAGVVRRQVSLVVAAGYAATLAVLAATWLHTTDRLDRELAAAPPGCIERDALEVDRDLLDHWSTTVLALVREGPHPRVVVADTEIGGCAIWDATGEIPFEATVDPLDPDGPWHTRP